MTAPATSTHAATLTYREAIRLAIYRLMEDDDRTVILGQGVSDPTRIFGTTQNLYEDFGAQRVIDTPIAEESTTGIAIGAALNGLYPIQTHIRVDFLLVAMNQLVNLAAKYRYMYGGAFRVPMLIRAIVGRSWGQGPQHSQSLQALFGHIPGLRVIMPSTAEAAYHSYIHSHAHCAHPVLSIEHRLSYDMEFYRFDESVSAVSNPFEAVCIREGTDVTIVATSYMVQEAVKAATWVADNHGLESEIIALNDITEWDIHVVCESLAKTGHLLVADTGWVAYGVCADVCRRIVNVNPSLLRQPPSLLGMQPSPCPTSHALERYFYPDVADVVDAILQQVEGRPDHGLEIPSKAWVYSHKRIFKGPF